MSTAPVPSYDFAPVQAVKKLWELHDLTLFNAESEKKELDPLGPIRQVARLYSDPKGQTILRGNFMSAVMQAVYGKLPDGRYRLGPRNAASYGAAGAQNVRFWSIYMAPYLLADLAPDRIGSLPGIVAETTEQTALQGSNAEGKERAKQELLQNFDAGEQEWSVIHDLICLTNDLAAELQIGCRKGLVETCDLVRDFEIRPCVTSKSAIAYMRSIGACNMPEAIVPRAKINWQTDTAALQALWNDFHQFGENRTRLAEKWGTSRQALNQPLKLAASQFGYGPINHTKCIEETSKGMLVKGSRY